MNEPNYSLPFFAYGALKPNEIAWSQISENCIQSESIYAEGLKLFVIGGIAVARPEAGAKVDGWLLSFSNSVSTYRRISKLEGVPNFYTWDIIATSKGKANVLVAASSEGKRSEVDDWSTASDPFLGGSIPYLYNSLSSLSKLSSGQEVGPDVNDKFLQLQSNYVLLWTTFERILRFTRPGLSGTEGSIRRESAKSQTNKSWTKTFDVIPQGTKLSCASSKEPYGKPIRFSDNYFEYFYALRNNIVHRGKGALQDFNQLHTSTIILYNLISSFLQLECPAVKLAWSRLDQKPNLENRYFQITNK